MKLKSLKSIEFYFENCDSIQIDGKYVAYILLDDIKKSIYRLDSDSVRKAETVQTFVIEISKHANKERYPFNITHLEDLKETVFERILEFKDIVGIQLCLSEFVDEHTVKDTVVDYDVHWAKGREVENAYQFAYVSRCGNLYLIISENKILEDFFNLDEINDDWYSEWAF